MISTLAMRSASSPFVMVNPRYRQAPSAVKLFARARQSRNVSPETSTRSCPSARLRSQSVTRRAGSANGNGRNSTALTIVKIVVLMPMATASVTTTTTAKPGLAASDRAD